MSDIDMSNSDTIKISGVAYTKLEARVLVAIINKWLNQNAVQPRVQADVCQECGASLVEVETLCEVCYGKRR